MKINRLSVLMLTAALMLSASATACSSNDKQDITEESTTEQTTQAAESEDEEVTDDTTEAESLISEESSGLVDIESGDPEQEEGEDPEETLAEGEAPDAIEGDPFFFHLEDDSDTGSVYVRVDYFLGDVQHGMMLVSHEPDESNVDLHFSEADFDFHGEENLDDFRAEFYLGYYDGDPDEGILQAYSGEFVDQTPVGSIEMVPEFGEDYDLIVEADPSSESGYTVRLA